MADGVELNAGTGGAIAATDDCGASGHAQVVKLAISTDGSATLIPAETTNGLDVDVTRVIPGTSATHLGKAEDTAHASGDTGVLALAVRRDTAAVGADTDGDNATINVDGSGRVWVNASGAAVPITDNAGSITVDNAALSVTGGGVEAAALRVTIASDSTGVLSVDDNGASITVDNAALSVTGGGVEATALRVTLASDSTGVLSVDDNGGSLTIDGTVTANLAAGTNNIGDVDILSIAAGDNNIGNVDIATIAAGDNNIGNVDIVTMPNVTLAAGTNTNEVVGDAADDAATAGNPVLIGGVAVETDGTDPTTVSAEGDVAYLRTDRARRLLVSEHHPRGWFVSLDYGAAQTNASVKAAPGAGLKHYITDIVISNGSTAGNITLLDGSGGTVVFEIYPAINGGVALSLKQPIVLTANTALCITSTTVVTHSVNIGGYIAP